MNLPRSLLLCLGLAAAAIGAAASCTSRENASDSGTTADSATAAESPKLTPTYDDHHNPIGLHQYNPYTDRITSGAQPEGEEAFRNLKALGYTTIVSVDGAKPDVETAKKYGLRYIHVPMQYSGVKPEVLSTVIKAINTSDGPVYIHCHHGKHRSAGATGAACVSLGLLTPEQAVAEMKVSGTDPKYKGLFRDAAGAKPVPSEQLAAVTFVEYCAPADLATSMVDVDTRWDHLKASKEAKWAAPPKHPDVDPPHEARMLWEHYREIARLDDAKQRGDEFVKHLAEAEASAKALEDALRAKDAAAADTAFARGGKACSSCHSRYRDN